jgi:hypothetical protein
LTLIWETGNKDLHIGEKERLQGKAHTETEMGRTTIISNNNDSQ